MFEPTKKVTLLCLISAVVATSAYPSTVNMGYASFDITFAPNVAQVDVVNETGPNASVAPDTTFPVATSVALNVTSLTVNFQTGPSSTYGPSYFTLDADGLSLDGTPSFNIALDPVTSVTLVGSYATTALTLNDGSSININPGFSVTITDISGVLADGDFAVLTATTASTGTPEPGTWVLLLAGIGLLLVSRRYTQRAAVLPILLGFAFGGSLLITSARGSTVDPVKLNAYTSPSSGVAGSTTLSATGTGFPAAPIPATDVTVSLATSCGGTAAATTTPVSVINIIGSSEKVEFLVPGSLATGLYYVSVSGMSGAGVRFASTDCSKVQVTKTTTVLGSCNPGSSMGIRVPAPVTGSTVPVTAYVPRAYWAGGTTGIEVVPIEGTGSASLITTSDQINSCSTNSVTGVSVCTANGYPAHVVLLSGTTLSATLTSASNTQAGFSGGYCYNCGVAVNSVTNQAVITMGYSGAASALQFLDLNTNSFGTVIPTTNEVSEDVLWDPFTNRVLSPDEEGYFDIFEVTGGGIPGPTTVTEASLYTGLSYQDSAGEDCTTGIALTVGEGSDNVLLADLKQATFTGTTWTAPNATYALPEFDYLSAGASAVAVAPGTTHLGVVAGEFGGDYVGVIQLPSTSGSGTPVIVDYVLAELPATPDGQPFSNGYDPHTTTAFTSPNSQKAYGVAASWATGTPAYVAVIDLQAMLAAPRTGAHTVSSSVNLLTSGIVRYVKATP